MSVTIYVERGDLDRALRQLRKQREGVVSTYERNERGFLSRGERRRMAERKARRKMRRRLAKERARMQGR
jgi:ribosomal protein S21